MVEQEAEWLALSARPAAPPDRHPARLKRRLLWVLAGLLLATTTGGVYALEQTAQAGWDLLAAELQNAVAADAALAVSTRQTPVIRFPTAQMLQVEVHGAQAVVQAVVTQTLPSGELAVYQTTDFYREGEVGWVRTPPTPAQLGPLQTLATEYFQVRYYALDSKMVREVAPRLDALYLQACASFGLEPAALAHQITFMVTTDPAEVAHVMVQPSGWTIGLPSPILLQLPVEETAADWLYASAAELLVSLVFEHTAPQPPTGEHSRRWQSLRDALRLWQVWQAGGALAAQRADVVRQFYGALPATPAYAACRLSPLWQTTALLASNLCQELAIQGTARPPAQLEMLAMHMYEGEFRDLAPWGEQVALETVVEYAVARYGPERLPVLVQAMDRHTTWTDLIFTVYGVSAAEFEAGWHAYLHARYGVAQDSE
jgi:hypothetical protein